MWKKYFGKKAKIIGIDFNPECKKFETKDCKIFIGDQADKNFWKFFFSKVGKVDIVLDDGGHTNHQQIISTLSCIPNIKNGGKMVVEDTHTSYQFRFGNPSKYSFINYSKKIIDDINSTTHPEYTNFKYSLRKFIYSVIFYESFCIFCIDRTKTYKNLMIDNKKKRFNYKDYRFHDSKTLNKLKLNFSFLLKYSFSKFIIKNLLLVYKYLLNKNKIRKYAKHFK